MLAPRQPEKDLPQQPSAVDVHWHVQTSAIARAIGCQSLKVPMFEWAGSVGFKLWHVQTSAADLRMGIANEYLQFLTAYIVTTRPSVSARASDSKNPTLYYSPLCRVIRALKVTKGHFFWFIVQRLCWPNIPSTTLR